MDPTHEALPAQRKYPALARSFRRGGGEQALRNALVPRRKPDPPDPSREHAELEEKTADFRLALAKKHAARVRDEIARYDAAIDAWAPLPHRGELGIVHGKAPLFDPETGEIFEDIGPEAIPDETLEELRASVTARKWHEGRERGQRERFQRVRDCGARLIIPACVFCGDDAKPIPEPCGVRRVCKRCDISGALKRRARFGRARGRLMIDAARYGLLRKVQKGGRYSEKMLTLTIPHVGDLALVKGRVRVDVDKKTGVVKSRARDLLDARIRALFFAWPLLLRAMRDHFLDTWQSHATFHRSFEWTPASDGHGHPHFHIYLWCKWLDVAVLREWWAEALRAVGWPVPKERGTDRSRVVVDLRMLRGFNVHAVRELMKGGHRSALTLSRVEFMAGPGVDAFTYAEGWTLGDVEAFCSSDVRARLYCALEARRLTQASRGFFLDDEPPICACCGGSCFRVRFEPLPEDGAVASSPSACERAPP